MKSKIFHIYDKGEMITLRKPGAILCTLALPQRGPYKVLKHYENDTIKIELEPNVVDRIHIRIFHPYYSMLEKDEQNPDVNTQQAIDES